MRVRTVTTVAALALGAMLTTSAPAGAQQLVDASGERGGGGLAFVLFAFTVMIMVAAMFFMDKVRRRRSEGDEPTSSN